MATKLGTTAIDNITGTSGSDTIYSFGGSDAVDGGNGDDTLIDTGGSHNVLRGGAGNDTISFSDEDGRNSIWMDVPGHQVIEAGDGNDLVTLSGYRNRGDVSVDLGSGNDELVIGPDENEYYQQVTNITLGEGQDRLTFGFGFGNRLRYGNQTVIVSDFQAGAGGDVLDLGDLVRGFWNTSSPPGPNPFADGNILLIQDGVDTIIRLNITESTLPPDAWNIVRLVGVNASQLTTANLGGYDPAGTLPISSIVDGTPGADTLHPSIAGDQVNGLGGDDRLIGGAGDDELNGDEGNDRIEGGSGDDHIAGGDGNDVLSDSYGNDTIQGGAGDDVITITRPSPGPYSSGLRESLNISAGAGDDSVNLQLPRSEFGPDNRILDAVIDLGDGNDHIVLSGAGIRTRLTLGAGQDHVKVGGQLVITDFQTGANGDVLELPDFSQFAQGGATPVANGYLRIRQEGADTLIGYDSDGEGGNDAVASMVLLIGVNAATLTAFNLSGYSPTGGTTIGAVRNGSSAGDVIDGSMGSDQLSGSGGHDRIEGGPGNDVITGGIGSDYIIGGYGDDQLTGGDGDDTIEDLDGGSDTVDGGEGDDVVRLANHYLGGNPNGHVSVDTGNGNDRVDIALDQPASLVVDLGAGNDWLRLSGQPGPSNSITLGTGSDILSLGYVYPLGVFPAVNINDFTAGDGGDRLDWLAFAQFELFDVPGDQDNFNPFELGKARLIQSGNDTLFQLVDPNPITIVVFKSTTVASFTNFNFGVDIHALTHPGTPGDDTLTGTAGIDRMYGYAGKDTLNGLGGADVLVGGDGADTLNGGDGNDALDGAMGIDVVNGGDGDDMINDPGGADIIDAGTGNDTITIGHKPDYSLLSDTPGGSLIAGSGNDRIFASPGFNGYTISAGPGDDFLRIEGSITVSLGSGVDTVELNQGGAIFTDFAAGAGGDIVNLDGVIDHALYLSFGGTFAPGGNPFAMGYANLKQVGSNVELWIDPDAIADGFYSARAAVFQNVTVGQLTAYNFAGADPLAPSTAPTKAAGNYTVAAAATEHITDPSDRGMIIDNYRAGVAVHYLGWEHFSFVNHGTSSVYRSTSGFAVGFLVDSTSNANASSFVNATDGKFLVSTADAPPGGHVAYGFYNGGGYDVSFQNDGLFEVNASVNATAILTGYAEYPNGAQSNVNNGTINVIAGTDAVGAKLGFGYFVNNGTMTVIGGETAIGIHANQFRRNIENHGDITVTTDPSSHYYSVGLLLDENVLNPTGAIINTGSINADIALYFRETSPSSNVADTLTNSGTINGRVYMSDGDDLVTNSGIMSGSTQLGRGNDVYDGALGEHLGTVEGGQGDDRLTGGFFDDFLFGDIGSDLLVGGAGDDFLDGGYGSDLIDGGAGFDTLSYLESPSAMSIDLGAGVAQGGIDIDYFRNIEAVFGSRGNDAITGSSGDDAIHGYEGDDQIDGKAGRDILIGGAGHDVITSGAGADRILFGQGDGADQITDFGAGDVIEIYGYGAASSITQAGANVLIQFSGTDSILVQNKLVADINASNLVFTPGASPLEIPDIQIRPLQTRDNLVIGAGIRFALEDVDPSLIDPSRNIAQDGRSYAVVFDNKDGAGLWNAGVIRYESSAFQSAVSVGAIVLGADLDTLVNAAGATIETVSHSSDAVAAYGFDALFNSGTLRAISDVGDAIGVQGMGFDKDFVNAGQILVTAAGAAYGSLQTGTSTPKHYFNSGSMQVSGGSASIGYDLRFSAHPLLEQPDFVNSGTITVTDQTADRDSIALYIQPGSKSQLWTSGSITADYVTYVNNVSYSASQDVGFSLYNSGSLSGTVSLSAYGDLIVNINAITGDVFMGGGNDVYDGRLGTLTGTLDGYDGDDTLLAGSGDQDIYGGFGADILSGGAGGDRLTGGYGQDHFRYATGFGADTITDFEAGASGDVIDVTGYSAYASIVQSGADVLITFSASDTLCILNSTVAAVTSAVKFGAAAIAPNVIPNAPSPPPPPPAPTTTLLPTQQFAPLDGTGGNDVLGGTIVNETINGLGGDDSLQGKGGNDTLDGGSGIDTAVFSGDRHDYAIASHGGGSFTVTDLRSGSPDGIDTISAFEFASFANSTIAIAQFLTAANDAGVTDEASVLAGNVLDNDSIEAGAKTVTALNGVAASIGQQITLASGAKLTLNANGSYSYNPNGKFNALVDASTGAANSHAGDNFTYTTTGGQTATVTITINGIGAAGDVLLGDGGDNNVTGLATTDVFNLSQGGNDKVYGLGGDDGFYFGAAMTGADQVDGGAGALDQLGLQGNYTGGNALTFGAYGLVNVEQLVLLPGSDTRFGDLSGSFYSYDITTLDANVGAGQQFVINANTLRAGESFTFRGAAELDGSFFVYGGLGNDNLTGGQKVDGFFFGNGGRFGAGDVVDGQGQQAGGLDQLGLQGNYTGANAINFGANQIKGIEMIVLLSGADARFGGTGSNYSFDLTMNDGNVAGGQKMIVNANTLLAAEAVTFNGGAETNGFFQIFSGAGNDSLIGSQSADDIWGGGGIDTITGGLGADTLHGGAGNDIFRYTSTAQSVSAQADQIPDFATGDKIDVSAIDAITGGGDNAFQFVGSAAFVSNGVGQLQAINNGGGSWTVSADVNGNGTVDLVIAVTVTDAHSLVGTDFVL